MKKLYDLHCHILPYVDDGAENLNEAVDMLRLQYQQGVRTVVLTPHFRSHFFETPQKEINRQFKRLCTEAAGRKDCGKLRLLLSREYYCDKRFEEKLYNNEIKAYGAAKAVLMEFSVRKEVELHTFLYYIRRVKNAGYTPIVAHAERYACIQKQPEVAADMIAEGAWIQINASAVLGKEGFRQKRLCKKLIKKNLIDLIASDSHHVEYRSPDMGECAEYLAKKTNSEYVKRILYDNPSYLIDGIKRSSKHEPN